MRKDLQLIDSQEPIKATDATLLEELTRKIHNEFSKISFSHARLVAEGLANVVVILDEKIVFRFPRTEKHLQLFSQEVQLLEKLHNKLPLPIPYYKYMSADKDFGGYQMIQGSDLTPELLEALPKNVKEKIAKQLGEFLSVLHTLPPDLVKDKSWHDPTFFKKRYLDKKRSSIANVIESDLLEKIDNFYEEFVELKASADAIIHGDVYGRHCLLAQNKSEISGVLDFGEASFGDRACDFFAFRKYGDDFFEQVLQNYTLEKGGDFINRSHWYLVRTLIDDLYRKIKKGEDATELVSAINEHLIKLKRS